MKPVLSNRRGVHAAKEQRHEDHPVVERRSVQERGGTKHHASAYCDLDQPFHDRRA